MLLVQAESTLRQRIWSDSRKSLLGSEQMYSQPNQYRPWSKKSIERDFGPKTGIILLTTDLVGIVCDYSLLTIMV
ncbi:hypothetical protein D3C80_2102440 [compost metagenome]